MRPGDEVELRIDGLSSDGDGVGRAGGLVLFVPRTAPGDRVRVRLTERKKGFGRAALTEVLTPSPDRVAPPCPRFVDGSCGGCQWQHVAMPAQHAAKLDIVARALRGARAAGLELAPLEAPVPAYGWRRRVRLAVLGGRVGFRGPRSHAVADVSACPQLEPGLSPALTAVRTAAPPDGELAMLVGHAGAISLTSSERWPAITGLVGQGGIAAVGAATIELEPGLLASADDFAQASATGNAALRLLVARAVGPGPGALLELYAGTGNFTRDMVAAGWDVVATDYVAGRGRHPAPRFVVGSADVVGPRLLAERHWDVVLLDPPRAGAAAVVAALTPAHAERVVYVSCDPATLGRDLQTLIASGFAPERGVPIDLMPQTSHVEVMVTLRRR